MGHRFVLPGICGLPPRIAALNVTSAFLTTPDLGQSRQNCLQLATQKIVCFVNYLAVQSVFSRHFVRLSRVACLRVKKLTKHKVWRL